MFFERRAGRVGVTEASSVEGGPSDLVDDLESSLLVKLALDTSIRVLLDSTNICAVEEF
jgi:hypothetical protein